MKLYPLTPSDKTDPAFLYIAETLAKAVKKITRKEHTAESVKELKNGLFKVKAKSGLVFTFDFCADTAPDVRKELAKDYKGIAVVEKINGALVVFTNLSTGLTNSHFNPKQEIKQS